MFHLAAASDPKIILEKDPELKIMLERLKTEGKTTFLMTNSPFDIVNAGMTYMFDENWRTLFDIVIVNAKKPSFFTAAGRHFRVYSPKTGRLKWQKVNNFRFVIFHTVRNLHFLSKNLTLISRDNCRFFCVKNS